MKKYIQLNLGGARKGMFAFDSEFISQDQAFNYIKVFKKEYGDSYEDLVDALNDYGIEEVEPDMILHLEDLDSEDVDVQLHPVQYKSNNSQPSFKLFVVGEKANQCRTVWEGDLFSTCKSQTEIEALKCVHNPLPYFIV